MKHKLHDYVRNKNNVLIVYLIMISPNAFAYLDPGTGGMIIQAIIAMFIGAGIFFGHLKLKISGFFAAIKRRFNSEKEEDIPSDNDKTKE